MEVVTDGQALAQGRVIGECDWLPTKRRSLAHGPQSLVSRGVTLPDCAEIAALIGELWRRITRRRLRAAKALRGRLPRCVRSGRSSDGVKTALPGWMP